MLPRRASLRGCKPVESVIGRLAGGSTCMNHSRELPISSFGALPSALGLISLHHTLFLHKLVVLERACILAPVPCIVVIKTPGW